MNDYRNIKSLSHIRALRCANDKELRALRGRLGSSAERLLDALSPTALLAAIKRKFALVLDLIRMVKG